MERYGQKNEQDDSSKKKESSSKTRKNLGSSLVRVTQSETGTETSKKPAGLEQLFVSKEKVVEDGEKTKEPAKKPEHTDTVETPSEVGFESEENPGTDDYMGELVIDHSDEGSESDDHVHDVFADNDDELSAEREVGEVPELIGSTLFDLEPVNTEIPEAPIEPITQPDQIAPWETAARDEEQPQTPLNSFDLNNMVDPNAYAQEAIPKGMVTEAESDDRALRAEKRGLSKGVVSGGLVGWLIGRRGKKQLRAELEQTQSEQSKLATELESEKFARAEADKKHESVISKLKKEVKKLTRQEKPQQAYRPTSRETTNAVPVGEISVTTEQINEIRRQELLRQNPEAAKDAGQQDESIYTPPTGRRVETSAWHSIEVDQKTGKAVEDSTISYGEAFKREQKQEKLNDDASQVQTAAFAGQAILFGDDQAMSTNSNGQAYDPVSSSQPTSNITGRVKKKSKIDRDQLKQQLSDPVIWIFAVIIVFGIIAILIIS